ncbi:DUF998 domain-containing protein [Agrococcus sp. SGAir0287]|uniref:DUF998 domain-containing protein n=1 Tax=Agrococcus sp. SGAir0287 TaxID=2070347 RepID=UPI001586DFDF|nr:DUF998 domain-containing protein [Agrococcus sp. SGAir0287]
MTASAPDLTDRRVARGGIALVATTQYLVAEQVVAAAWAPAPYSFGDNYISDLGVPECLVLADRVVCSPQWLLMDAAFVLQGLLVVVATWQLAWLLPRVWRWIATALGVVHGVGMLLVGLFPGSIAEDLGGDATRAALHGIGATLAIAGGIVWMLVAGIGLLVRRWRGVGVLSLVLAGVGAVGLVGLALLPSTPGADLGLGVGGIERLAVYPIIAWLILMGIAAVLVHRGALRQEQWERMRAEDEAAAQAALDRQADAKD